MVRIPEVMSALEREHIAYRLIEAQSAEADALVSWLEARFPIVFSGIDWSRIHVHRCVEWANTEDLVPSFVQMAAGVRPDVTVKVMWSDGLSPSLELLFREVVRVAAQLFEADFDTWIICEPENWCFEIYHEGTLCFGDGQPPGE